MLTDASMRQTRARILNAKQGGQFVQGSKCQKGWSVYLTEGADDIKKIRKLIDDYLAPIEASGTEEFSFHTDAATSPAICKIFRDLGVEAGCVTKWKPPENRICTSRRHFLSRTHLPTVRFQITLKARWPAVSAVSCAPMPRNRIPKPDRRRALELLFPNVGPSSLARALEAA
jgi:hypothetical protein